MSERQKLSELQEESRDLEIDIFEAKRAGDFARIKFLKLREAELPNELYAQRILALREEIAELKAENESDLRAMREAKEASANIDAEVAPQIVALRAEISRLTKQSLWALAKPSEIQERINQRSHEIDRLRRQIEAM